MKENMSMLASDLNDEYTLTKNSRERDRFTAACYAMQGILSNSRVKADSDDDALMISGAAVEMADALLKELDQKT